MTLITHELSHDHLLGLTTSLGDDDALLLTAFTGQEMMSGLFTFHLDMISARETIEPQKIVGQNVTFWVVDRSGVPRFFNGCVSRFNAGSWSGDVRHYSAQVVPWLWFLTNNVDCVTFVNKTVVEILEEVFDRYGFHDYSTHGIKGEHPSWEYCVQYRESDFNFVSRLMEQEGIYYFFRHERGRHELVLGDQKSGYVWCKDREVEYSTTERGPMAADHVTEWNHGYHFIPGQAALTDHNFHNPIIDVETPAQILNGHEMSVVSLPDSERYQVFDYPGEYCARDEGQVLARMRMEEEEAQYDVAGGSSNCRMFTAGAKFRIVGNGLPDEQGKTYVLTSLEHAAMDPSHYAAGGRTGGWVYTNSFTCIPDDVVFRPRRLTSRPAIHGSQTALVVGPRNEEIWTDEHGRVQIQFHWDRYSSRTGENCCWVRCAQSIAGKGWGAMFIPRVGQEVVVSFLEGNPDRPLVTGVVYNADQTPAYPLPAEKTKSYVKTCSSPGGDGFNEIRFEDRKGEEQIFIHAERNLDTHVGGSHVETIAGNRDLTVGSRNRGDFQQSVAGDKKTRVGRHMTTRVDNCYGLEVSSDTLLNLHGLVRMNCGGDLDMVGNEELRFYSPRMIYFDCGNSRLALEPDRIVLYSPSISLNSEFGPFRGNGATGVNDLKVLVGHPAVTDPGSSGRPSTPWPGGGAAAEDAE